MLCQYKKNMKILSVDNDNIFFFSIELKLILNI